MAAAPRNKDRLATWGFLRADDGMVWRVGVPLAPLEMLGKEATIWAELTDAPHCGGLVMNRAVYAEHAN